ncbi:hypothetical protein BDV93DRAFT_236638 [Ceratobasidium sp. AG-I]|nr:hypothetical protein BDV93DRAFT_236638 [Ceratobasidium sp. AG-I]
MTTLASGTYFPSQLIGLILSNVLSRKQLINMSLVSRSWQRLAFPVLWYQVQLTQKNQMEKLVVMLETEPDNSDLRISVHLRSLRIGLPSPTTLGPNLMLRFEQLIPKLAFLTHLTWSRHLSEGTSIFQAFQQCCPMLRSVNLYEVGFNRLTSALDQFVE